MCACECAHVCSVALIFATLWTVAHQAPLSMEFSQGRILGSVGNSCSRESPNTEIQPMSLVSSELSGRFFMTYHWEASKFP